MAVHAFTYLHLFEGFYHLLPLNLTQTNCEYPPHIILLILLTHLLYKKICSFLDDIGTLDTKAAV